MNIAIVIGHDSKSPGAVSKYLGLSEYIYHSEVASSLSTVADILKRPNARGYTAQMQALQEEVKDCDYDLIIELHFNSFNSIANGTETVTYKGNERSKEYGKQFNEIIAKKFNVKNRGEKEVTNGGRGFGFLSLMPCDAIILEPFFGDNGESLNFKDPKEYAIAIKEWLLKIQE
jgi:N-acetylmuramoyl-L-alanine amidase